MTYSIVETKYCFTLTVVSKEAVSPISLLNNWVGADIYGGLGISTMWMMRSQPRLCALKLWESLQILNQTENRWHDPLFTSPPKIHTSYAGTQMSLDAPGASMDQVAVTGWAVKQKCSSWESFLGEQPSLHAIHDRLASNSISNHQKCCPANHMEGERGEILLKADASEAKLNPFFRVTAVTEHFWVSTDSCSCPLALIPFCNWCPVVSWFNSLGKGKHTRLASSHGMFFDM